jgi:hypothetical protein
MCNDWIAVLRAFDVLHQAALTDLLEEHMVAGTPWRIRMMPNSDWATSMRVQFYDRNWVPTIHRDLVYPISSIDIYNAAMDLFVQAEDEAAK